MPHHIEDGDVVILRQILKVEI